MARFQEVFDKHGKNLELYVPVVARVHGPTHPEFLKVRDYYDTLMAKVGAEQTLDLGPEFAKLREVTHNYQVPQDTCETYAAVYTMLKELDEAYGL